jgi:hypothetical protein
VGRSASTTGRSVRLCRAHAIRGASPGSAAPARWGAVDRGDPRSAAGRPGTALARSLDGRLRRGAGAAGRELADRTGRADDRRVAGSRPCTGDRAGLRRLHSGRNRSRGGRRSAARPAGARREPAARVASSIFHQLVMRPSRVDRLESRLQPVDSPGWSPGFSRSLPPEGGTPTCQSKVDGTPGRADSLPLSRDSSFGQTRRTP